MPRISTKPLRKIYAYFDSDILSGRQMMAIYLPLAGEQLFHSIVGLLSTWMLAGVGEAAVSAVSMINVSNQLFIQACVAFGVGATVVVAQYTGAGNARYASRTLQQAIFVSFTIGLAVGALMIMARVPAVNFFLAGAPREVIDLALIYFTGVSVSLPLLGVNQAFSGSMRGLGQTKVAMLLSMTTVCLELIFSASFVLGLKMGVTGVTLSILASRAIGVCFVVTYLRRYRREFGVNIKDFFHPIWLILRGLVIVSVPVALEQVFFSSGKALTQRYIASYGTAHMTANAVSSVIQGIGIGPASALSSVAMTIVGRCIGREQVDLAKTYTRKLSRVSVIMIGASIIPIIPLTVFINHIYNVSPEVTRLVVISLIVYFTGTPFLFAGSFITPNALRAGGDAMYTSVVALCSMWAVRVLLAYLFTRVFAWGVVGVIAAMVLEWTTRGLLFTIRFNGDKWYRHKVIIRD